MGDHALPYGRATAPFAGPFSEDKLKVCLTSFANLHTARFSQNLPSLLR